ncbi:MAG: NifU-like protein [Chloroflexi bacterium ADurb.Bin325]|nr:MAG: NifU-like protein [Chloroflexi bacterium ADurb.Bin325]
MDLYAEEILDHYKNPRHFGHLEHPTLTYHDSNPFCGDEITLELKIEDNKIVDAAFSGHGCAISRAAASMMIDEIIGKPLSELKEWTKDEILDLLGIEVGPVRMKCALLPLKAMKVAVWGLADETEER